jgi:hypothetical protein
MLTRLAASLPLFLTLGASLMRFGSKRSLWVRQRSIRAYGSVGQHWRPCVGQSEMNPSPQCAGQTRKLQFALKEPFSAGWTN